MLRGVALARLLQLFQSRVEVAPTFDLRLPPRLEVLVDREEVTDLGTQLLRQIVEALERAGVRWGVSAPTENVNGFAFADYAPLLAQYLAERFVPAESFGYWTLQRR